jgi:drug/metabolite transporter (DMT)-like permease
MRQNEGASVARLGVALAFNPWFIAAVALYAALSAGWVWILAGTPLSTAYPFAALAFVFTPLLGHFLFGEPFGWNQAAGLALIVVGLALAAR